eukprot:3688324-Heterocapsa_arctica.AAC.1
MRIQMCVIALRMVAVSRSSTIRDTLHLRHVPSRWTTAWSVQKSKSCCTTMSKSSTTCDVCAGRTPCDCQARHVGHVSMMT